MGTGWAGAVWVVPAARPGLVGPTGACAMADADPLEMRPCGTRSFVISLNARTVTSPEVRTKSLVIGPPRPTGYAIPQPLTVQSADPGKGVAPLGVAVLATPLVPLAR